MKRLICFLMLLFVVTGCSYKYNIEIDKKKTVLEELNIYELNSVFVNKGTSANSFVDININIYKKDSSLSQYNISKKISDPSSGVIASASYDSFSDYTKKTKIKKNLFGRIELYEWVDMSDRRQIYPSFLCKYAINPQNEIVHICSDYALLYLILNH